MESTRNKNRVKDASMVSFDKNAILERIGCELKIPKNYKSRLCRHLKKYREKKSPQELCDHIISDWNEYSGQLEKFWDAAKKIHDEFLRDLNQKHIALETLIQEKLEVDEFLSNQIRERYRSLFHERRIQALNEYISIGVNPSQAAEMVIDTDHRYDTEAMQKHLTQELLKWQKREH